jgi:hypothetical protein
LGKRQSGKDAMSAMRSARLPQDKQLLDDARICAANLIADWQEGVSSPPPKLLAAVHAQDSLLLEIDPVAALEIAAASTA